MGEKGDGELAEAAIFVEMVTGTEVHKSSKYSRPTAKSGQRSRTMFARRLFLHGRRVAEDGRAVNLRKYPSGVNFRNQPFTTETRRARRIEAVLRRSG